MNQCNLDWNKKGAKISFHRHVKDEMAGPSCLELLCVEHAISEYEKSRLLFNSVC